MGVTLDEDVSDVNGGRVVDRGGGGCAVASVRTLPLGDVVTGINPLRLDI